jgi:hypothetical protein
VGCERALKDKVDSCYEDWIDENWINILFQKCGSHRLKEILDNLKIVTFNYDRTFEFFAERYLTNLFGKLEKDVKKNFFEKNVKHVYGKIGCITTYPYGNFNNDETEEMKNVVNNINLMYL